MFFLNGMQEVTHHMFRILLAGGSREHRRRLVDMLQKKGYRVTVARNDQEIIQPIEQAAIDLLVFLPGISDCEITLSRPDRTGDLQKAADSSESPPNIFYLIDEKAIPPGLAILIIRRVGNIKRGQLKLVVV